MRIPNRLLPHKNAVVIEGFEGSGADGDIYTAPILVPASFIEEKNRLVRNSTGDQVVSSATVILPLEYWAAPSSRVTIWANTPQARTTILIVAARNTFNGATPNHAALSLE